MTHEEWVRKEIRRGFAASVEFGIGCWPKDLVASCPDFGASLYHYDDADVSVTLYSYGIVSKDASGAVRLRYTELDAVIPVLLTELVRVRDLNAAVPIQIEAQGTVFVIRVPLRVYSALCPVLAHIAKHFYWARADGAPR
ncbi:hypothetical protein WMF20_37505 [Sorangium sp. So ce834]|uniref:hypothetical protein n=1 Tax=Sorangium sp. So ce834 TaxID=3133321 RepID=UPI003F63D6A9